jgi:MFS family permease
MSTASPRWPLAGLSLTMLMSSLDTSIANTALPALSHAFGASFQSVRWVVLAYLLTLTVLTVIVGRLGDIAGRRRLLLAGLVVFTLASLACGVAPNLVVLLAARAAQGLGAAGMMSLAVALVGDIVPAAKTGRAMGLLGTMSAIGTTLGPSLGGVLTARFGWEAIFLVNLPIGMLALLLVYRGVPADRAGARATHVDAVAGISLLRTRAINASLFATVLVAAVMMTTLVVGPFYLSRSLGLDAAEAGVALSIGPLVAVLAGWPAGRLVDRFGAPAMTLAGLIGLAAGASMVGVVSVTSGVAGYVAPIAGMTASYALFQAANNTFLMTTAGPRHRGAIAGMLGLGRNVGLIAGAWAMGIVFAWAVGTGDAATANPDVVAAGVRVTFRVSAGLIAAGIAVVASARASTRRSASSDHSLHHARALTHSQGR